MSSPSDEVQRDVLPIPDRPYAGELPLDAKDPDASFPAIEPLQPPAGAPNVLVVLLDDVGFAASSAFGGPCATPTAERLAGNGLKYNRFHTTALCAPTRAALLSGRNHHTMGMGVITELATAAPGYNAIRPNTRALIFSADETADLGRDIASPVSDDYDGESSIFTGTVSWVQIDLPEDAEDADHLITPQERLRVAMARQ
jgi:hypothetical protein